MTRTLLALFLLLPLPGCRAGELPAVFSRAVPLDTPAGPSSLEAGDLNGDDHLDLLVTLPEGLLALLGDGRGGFRTGDLLPAGDNPVDSEIADMDGDGVTDIVVANHETHRLTLLFGEGEGRFEPAVPLPVAVEPHPHSVAVADMDRDGRLDLITDHRQRGGVLILPSRGERTFGEGVFVATGGDPYRGVAIGDVSGDGWLDLITPNPSEVGLTLHRGNGYTFKAPRSLPAPSPFAVALGDVNGDGLSDIAAAADQGSSELHLLAADGRGGFASIAGSPYRTSPGAKKIAVGDVDGDGRDDLAVTGWDSDELALLHSLDPQPALYRLRAGENPWAVAMADFDEDGRSDLAVLGNGGGGWLYLTR